MLRLVPKRQPDQIERALLRIKSMARPNGMLQCPRCGGRSEITEVAGSYVKDGRKQQGTVIHRGICALCYKSDSIVQMTTK